MGTTKKRYENDSFGKIAVPEDFLWAAQTQRSLNNFTFIINDDCNLQITIVC